MWREQEAGRETYLKVRSNERGSRGRQRSPRAEDFVVVVGRPCRP